MRGIAALALLLVTGCSAVDRRTEVITYGSGFPAVAAADSNALQWQAIRFRMPRDRDGNSNWTMDPMLAHKVVGPALLEYSDRLPLWRFHRRSAPDAAGHQFSFIFFTDAATADALHAWVAGEPLLNSLKQAGLLLDVLHEREGFDRLPRIAATSDPSWSPELQAQWPSFIMGASSIWLGLINETLPEPRDEHETLESLLGRYGIANDKVTRIWSNEGQHAFFHHLSAIFGYRAVKIRKSIHF